MQDEEKDWQGAIVPDTAEKAAYVKGLVDNGQAAKALPDGRLPRGATHEIVGETPSGLPIVKRRGFNVY
jgi:hypothetical protein